MSILEEIRKMKAARQLEYELIEALLKEKEADKQAHLAKKIQYARERLLRCTLLVRDLLERTHGS